MAIDENDRNAIQSTCRRLKDRGYNVEECDVEKVYLLLKEGAACRDFLGVLSERYIVENMRNLRQSPHGAYPT